MEVHSFHFYSRVFDWEPLFQDMSAYLGDYDKKNKLLLPKLWPKLYIYRPKKIQCMPLYAYCKKHVWFLTLWLVKQEKLANLVLYCQPVLLMWRMWFFLLFFYSRKAFLKQCVSTLNVLCWLVVLIIVFLWIVNWSCIFTCVLKIIVPFVCIVTVIMKVPYLNTCHNKLIVLLNLLTVLANYRDFTHWICAANVRNVEWWMLHCLFGTVLWIFFFHLFDWI